MARFDGIFRDCKISNEEHDGFVKSNKRLALAEEPVVSRDDKGYAISKNSCKNCQKKKHCKKNEIKTVVKGVASVGSDSFIDVCGDWKEQKEGNLSGRQQKNLLKQFSKLIKR